MTRLRPQSLVCGTRYRAAGRGTTGPANQMSSLRESASGLHPALAGPARAASPCRRQANRPPRAQAPPVLAARTKSTACRGRSLRQGDAMSRRVHSDESAVCPPISSSYHHTRPEGLRPTSRRAMRREPSLRTQRFEVCCQEGPSERAHAVDGSSSLADRESCQCR